MYFSVGVRLAQTRISWITAALEDNHGNHRSIWVTSYDINKKAYRSIRFTNTGLISESTGQWNERTGSLDWKVVNAPAGITSTSTGRFEGKDRTHKHILAKTRDGRVHRDLTIKGTRRK